MPCSSRANVAANAHRGRLGAESCTPLDPALFSCSTDRIPLTQRSAHPCRTVQPEAGQLGVDVSSVALPVVPIRSRQTRSGDTCILPTVYQASHWQARPGAAGEGQW